MNFYFEAWGFTGQGHEGKLMALASVLFFIFIFKFSINNYALRVILKLALIKKKKWRKDSHSPQPQATAANSPVALGATGLGVT